MSAITTRHEITLVVMMKRPRLGQGKQRLAATLGVERAYQLATCLLACALEDAQAWSGPVVLAPASAKDASWAARLLPKAQVVSQSTGNLGQRLQHLDRLLRAQGAERLLYMGTDAPALSAEHFAAATRQLITSDVVLSRATDGGVTLMGNRQPWPELERLPWSTDRLGDALALACNNAGLSVSESLSSYDIDLESDLYPLRSDLQQDARSARGLLLEQLQFLPAQAVATPATGVLA